jgi:hypothetical protein
MKSLKSILYSLVAMAVLVGSPAISRADTTGDDHNAVKPVEHHKLGGVAAFVLTVSGLGLVSMLGLNPAWFPTPQDEVTRLEAVGTNKTASFNGTSFLIGVGYSPGGIGSTMAAVLAISLLDKTTGDETYVGVLQESADGTTFTDCGPAVTITATGVISLPGFVSYPYVRAKLTLGGTTPIITYEAWLNSIDD